MSHYTPLSIEERERSRSLLESGSSIRAITRILGRSPSTISREFKRNRYANDSYAAHHAQKKYLKRKSGFLIAFKLDTKTEKEFSEATIGAFKSISKKLKKSFTVDNGKEVATHEYIKEQTGMEVYFCDPYSPWQRGTNENTNGLLRQFFPKVTSLKDVTNEKLQKVVD